MEWQDFWHIDPRDTCHSCAVDEHELEETSACLSSLERRIRTHQVEKGDTCRRCGMSMRSILEAQEDGYKHH